MITDADGSTAPGTLTVTFDDDAPTATNEASQNVAEGATVTGTLDFVAGADGATVTHIGATALVFNPADSNYSQAIDIGDGFIKVKADGSYSFTADNPVNGTGAASATFTVTDGDGDTASANIAFAVTDANHPTTGTASAAVDDDGLTGGNPASTTGDLDANTGEVPFSASEATYNGTLGGSVGGDGAGANGFSFAALNGTSGTVGLENVTYSVVGNMLTATTTSGSRIGTALFQVQITDPATGAYTVTLLDNVLHAGGPNNEATDATVNLGYVITDADGSTAPGTLTVTFDDDSPSVLDKTDLYFANSGTVSGTGVFDYSIGADGHTTYSAVNSDFAAITLAGTVAGNAITAPTVAWASETSTEAVFNVSFSYLTGGVSTQETGTITFDKVAGTYTVDLVDPISAVTISTVSNSSSIVGYQPGSSTIDNSQPDVAVAQVNANLFIQFTGYSEPGAGTGADNLQSGSIDGNPLTYVNGELITQSSSYVSISGTANGVAGDTMGKGEVIDMDFFTTNPTGFTALTPDAQVSSMFLKFDGIGSSEDFIVILKLYDTVAGTYTTKAVFVENGDIFKGPGTGPGIYSGVTLDNNDGLLIIESNDYNAAGQNYVLVGAQITPTDEGITGTAINLNGAIGAGGASTTTQNLSSDTNDLGFKVSDIGLVSTTTTAQNADLTFNVTVKDADGDTSTAQQLDVHVVNGVTYAGTADAESMQGTANGDTLNGSGGNDILQGFAGNDTLTGGAGADTMTGGIGADTFVIGAGDSTPVIGGSGNAGTISGYDIITDFVAGTDKLSLPGTLVAATAGNVNGGDSTLTIGGDTVQSHSLTNGIASFFGTDSFTQPLAVTSTASLAAVVQYLTITDIGNAGATLAFTATIAAVSHTFVYTQTGAGAGVGTLVDLQGVTIADLNTLITGSIDPIILDLNHDGFAFSDVNHGVQFDLNGDGTKDQVSWNTSHDGMLVVDLNHDGKIDDGTELFTPNFGGGSFASGAAALASLDSNHDGLIDHNDAAFDSLLIWKDANANGISDAGELSNLAHNDITSISTTTTSAVGEIDGQAVTGNGTFQMADGTTGNYVEVELDTSLAAPAQPDVASAGTSGADTFKIDNLDIKDLIADYHGGEGDKIDLSALFDKAPAGNIADYVHYDSATSTVSVDTSGSGNAANFVDVAVLQNAPAAGTINILYDDTEHQQHTATI
ncbi:type I secretion C-terminal target domain-containing protein [Mesorhizobium sp. WSM4303]|uniref:beta strand repeat-containing protein n=2 Tax=unclassified Mesorhizobium TaxID=325217 RepID=UPI001AED538B|nr:type I secretion C-terminal target domain-containing protein [Mesorhizobium sp. WSM4303]